MSMVYNEHLTIVLYFSYLSCIYKTPHSRDLVWRSRDMVGTDAGFWVETSSVTTKHILTYNGSSVVD